MGNISELYDNLEKVTKDLKEQRISLQSELSNVDKEISDIRHYIEFYPLNACQGYDIVNIGLHFFLKNVRPYAASCSEA